MEWKPLTEWATKPEYDLILTAVVGALLLWNLYLSWRWRRFQRQWHLLLRNAEGRPLDALLYESLRRLTQLEESLERQDHHLQQLQAQVNTCLQQVGLVRFDAFEDVGGKQSFALALLNAHGDGMIMSGLHSRQEMRVYVKPLQKHQSGIALSQEEEQAIRQATDQAVLSPSSKPRINTT